MLAMLWMGPFTILVALVYFWQSPIVVSPSPEAFLQYSDLTSCSNSALSDIFSSLPRCQPRRTLVKLDLPAEDPSIEEVLPSHVEVPRCAGSCYRGSGYHTCVPNFDGRSQETFQVYFLVSSNGFNESHYKCSTAQVETHTKCKCGCDVQNSQCNELQIYDHFSCKCRCTNHSLRRDCLMDRRRKRWNDKTCQCLCRDEVFKECSTGFIYDHQNTCHRCIPGERLPASFAGMEALIIFVILFAITLLSALFLAWKLWKMMKDLHGHQVDGESHKSEELSVPINCKVLQEEQ